MASVIIREAAKRYGIDDWGSGYFSINEEGNVVCHPTGEPQFGVPLTDIVEDAKRKGLKTPLILRFPQIIRKQLENMHQAFATARTSFRYEGQHFGVFPFKVNQRKEFIDAIVSCGRSIDWGLEVGSKTEFMAALSYPMSDKSLLICNGFKDKEFIDMAFTAAKMNRNIILVAEGPDELQEIIDRIKQQPNDKVKTPDVGLRVRLYSRGSGKWQKSSGQTSKFGLTSVEMMHALDILTHENMSHKLTMLHFHIGSQITAIKRFKTALKEAARVYAKVCQSGFTPPYLNIGGGVGVDYDGSKTTANSSANYSLQEFANDAIYTVGKVCEEEGVKVPNIVTESGRVIAAYHSVVVTDIREVQGEESFQKLQVDDDQIEVCNKKISDLYYVYKNISLKNYNEFYHDAVEDYEEIFTLFTLGYINLKERSIAEHLFHSISQRVLQYATEENRAFGKTMSQLENLKVTKYLANFSIFQSIPDAWSIDQLFPVMPISRHNEHPEQKGTIVDITCDSDGCVDRFIDPIKDRDALDLHSPNGKPYYIGFFLVGAYQESLSNEHNLFGAIHESEVFVDQNGEWYVSKITPGDLVSELLTSRNYSMQEMINSYEMQISKAVSTKHIGIAESHDVLDRLKTYLHYYPYLVENNRT